MRDNKETYIAEHFSEAIEKGYIQSYYQPIYRSMTGKVACAEALARWFDPVEGMFSPADFIPVLERCGRIYELDMEILRQTCAFYRELRNKDTLLHSFSVNLSRHDFRHDDLFDTITGILDTYDVPRDAIKLEITESLMMEDVRSFDRIFRQFTDAGFSVWMDDFGSGYSSLNVLQKYNFDVIKFDMLFLRDYTVKSRQVLSSLIHMVKTLGIHTLTEGVETEEQKEFLRSVGCEAQQGFYYAKPLSGKDLAGLLREQPDILETVEDMLYWNRIGCLDLVSSNPLDEFPGSDHDGMPAKEHTDNIGIPLALLERRQDKAQYVYASGSYLDCIRDLGYESLSELEAAFNDRRSDQYLMIRKLITDAIAMGTTQMVEYINNDVYYRLSARCLARKSDRAMLALHLSTFDSEHEVKTAQEMLNYGNALFSTYELVVLIYPESNLSTRIYTTEKLPTYDREGSLEMSVKKFSEAEVAPVDRERYIRFLDFKTIPERIAASSKGFVQGFFRMRWTSGGSNWYTVRVTAIPASAEMAFLLTIQTLQGPDPFSEVKQ